MIYEGIDIWNSPYLEHHGVKGMKWGVRHDNPNYSEAQRKRDRQVYGRGGVRRINRSMNQGESISAARSREARRINTTRMVAAKVGSVTGMIGGIGGAVAGYKFSQKILQKYGTGDQMTDTTISAVASGGAFRTIQALSRIGGQSLTMMARGYSPSKFRYV